MTDHQLVQGTVDFVIRRQSRLARSRGAARPGLRAPTGVLHACNPDTKMAKCGEQCTHTWKPWPPGMGDRCPKCVKLVDGS